MYSNDNCYKYLITGPAASRNTFWLMKTVP